MFVYFVSVNPLKFYLDSPPEIGVILKMKVMVQTRSIHLSANDPDKKIRMNGRTDTGTDTEHPLWLLCRAHRKLARQ